MRKEMLSPKDHAVMAFLHTLISIPMQILHRSVVDHMSGQDDHEVVSAIREGLEFLVELQQIHAAER